MGSAAFRETLYEEIQQLMRSKGITWEAAVDVLLLSQEFDMSEALQEMAEHLHELVYERKVNSEKMDGFATTLLSTIRRVIGVEESEKTAEIAQSAAEVPIGEDVHQCRPVPIPYAQTEAAKKIS